MRQSLDRIAPLLPWLGALLVIAGFVAYSITRLFNLLPNLLLGFGLLLLLLYAVIRPDAIRRRMSGRRTRFGLLAFFLGLFVTALMVLVYMVTFLNPDWRLDLTESNEFTPLSETIDLLRQVNEPIQVIGFFSPTQFAAREQASRLLDSLKAVNERLTYRFEDVEANPLLVDRYDVTFPGTLVFVRGSGPDEVFSKSPSVSENDIHTALVRVINPTPKTVYFLTRHGERTIDDPGNEGLTQLTSYLEEIGFTVLPLDLAATGRVPDDASVLAIVDQTAPLRPEEMDRIRDYVSNGGGLLVARDLITDRGRLEAEQDGMSALLLDEFGIRIQQDVVVEMLFSQADQSFFDISFLAFEFDQTSPIIDSDIADLGMVFSGARSVATQASPEVSVTRLVSSSSDSWGETNLVDLFNQGLINQDLGEDFPGPVALGATAENNQSGARSAVFGDADFMANSSVFQQANYLVAANVLNWLAGDEAAISLTPRDTVQRQIVIPDTQLRFIRFISLWLAPLLMMTIGVVVGISRRARR